MAGGYTLHRQQTVPLIFTPTKVQVSIMCLPSKFLFQIFDPAFPRTHRRLLAGNRLIGVCTIQLLPYIKYFHTTLPTYPTTAL